jgi:UDP-N-acetylglucosamine:LPS N-acetylglucosamine transferase
VATRTETNLPGATRPGRRAPWWLPSRAPRAIPAGAPYRVLLVCSSGGHLAQLMKLRPWWGELERSWACFQLPDAESRLADEQVTWVHHPTTRNVRNLVRNLILSVKVLRRDRPDVIISTGAGVAVPFFWVGRLLGMRTVYLEVYDRIDSATMTGRLCRPVTDLFLVQWPEQRSLYRDTINAGPVY